MALFLGCVAAVTVLAADYVVCPSCGYENDALRDVCVHCGGALGATAVKVRDAADEAATRAEPPPAPEEPVLDPAAVDEDVVLGREHLRKGDSEIARLLFRNAAAMNMLIDSQKDGLRRGEELLKLVRECEAGGMFVSVECAACGGTGKQTASRTEMTGPLSFSLTQQKACEKCGGTGRVRGVGTIDERKYVRGRAEREYALLQQGRRRVAVGRAWIPPATAERLSVSQSAALRCALAEPCGECMGFGRTDCRACNGKGRVDCPERDCDGGTVRVAQKSSWSKTVLEREEKCRKCRGLGYVMCAKCDGKGSLVCDECNGTGQRDVCARCSGSGMAACRQCKGAGLYRGQPCAACGGSGNTLCSTCNGDGRKR